MAATKVDQAVTGRECPTCKMRFRFGDPPRKDFLDISVSARTYSYLLGAAVEFDETAQELTPGEMYTAVDFLDWLKDSLVLERAA